MPRFFVDWEDIRQGRRDCGDRCPVALCIKRSMGVGTVTVDIGTILIDGQIITTPEIVEEFIQLFDEGDCDIQPFSFDLVVEGSFSAQ